MGMDPKTKADCDRAIARAEETLAWRKKIYEEMKSRPGNYSKEAIGAEKAKVEYEKGQVKKLKALRKTLK